MADVALPSRAALADERSPVRHIDLSLAACGILLSIYGVLMIYSATNKSLVQFGQDPALYLKKQVIFLVLGVIALVVLAALDYRLLKLYAPFFYIGMLALLLLVQTPLGTAAKGAQRSFSVAGFQFSPSLFTRLALILMLAAMLSEVKRDLTLRDVFRATGLALIPMLLVFIQPDLGTTIVLSAVLATLLLVSGAKARYLVTLVLIAGVGFIGALQLHIVKDYQVQRIVSFLDPKSADAQRAGYNKQQAEIAIGAGGMTGRGYLHGTQTNLDFVPEQHTDFIFTVVGEELGFLGGLVLLTLFSVVLWRAYRIALMARDPFGTFAAAGIAGYFAIQVFINVGMTIGIMPITGIPLPFISYGGSALIADLMALGVLESIHMRRFL
ncbi:MAG TPA: rod shape-determining protein RodA [Actinomycetota bacterium]|nr:rod shape-determining protein RodA [Actinomycetota bacterium]